MIQRKIAISFLLGGICLALGVLSGKVIAFEDGFSSPQVDLGEQTLRIQPFSEISLVGGRLGLPLYEMRNLFFVRISYECHGDKSQGIEIIKNGTAAIASEVFHVGKKCNQTFRSPSPMAGTLTVRFRYGGKRFEERAVIDRRTHFSCPLWDMLMSA
jgi:hypothetical protein